ncbi:hypothetical protein EPUS_09285 [Endocarpon pusillum Z07020]|uniref:Short chain oxidoreductase n=1 Tax=Endocarpon pusillum (strain Z07020 / HMAS-L-300199) TaxID=1263415 RepID=U1GPB3_ENDPU|nr:uncharacterized protein EPUS_09285 [Endocarpon pusillum Z07020]ERF73791.1 hypothetical protein EPUS_09285 [Endocarpon pusillum Z07020]
MASYLITGASRGIGLELTKQLLELPVSQVGKVFAVTRSGPSAPLRGLIDRNPDRATHIIASVDDTESVQRAARDVKAKLGGQGLDVLVNNAGQQAISPGGTKTAPPEQLAHLFDVNVIGPQRVTAAFLPLLEAGNQKKVINVTSSMGSIAWVDRYKCAPSPAYKISKAALHMLNAQYALDHAEAGFTFLCVSPGWLKTDLGGEYADFDVGVGVTELKRIILESTKAQNGKFLNILVPGEEKSRGQYDGGEIPW